MTSLELVVSRFEEDLAWLRRVPKVARVSVYDKSEAGAAGIQLPNIGREAHTYLHHIVNRYDDLAEVTVFVQGKPFDHVPDLHKLLRALASGARRVEDFLWLGFVLDWDDPRGSRLYQNWTKNPERHPLALDTFHRELFGEPCPDRVIFYPSGHFVATREAIRRRPLSFYEKALALSGTFPEAAHCFERCWNRVFMADGVPSGITWEQLPIFTKPIRRLLTNPPHPAP